MKNLNQKLLTAAGLVLFLTATSVSAQVKDHAQIKYPRLPEFKIDRPQVYELPNGMTVFLMEDHELPLVNVSARIRTGSDYDPEGLVGLADIFGQVHREGGTASMSGDEMDDFLAERAASIETGMGGDAGFASMSSLGENFDEIFSVFVDVLRKPVFAEDKLVVAKVQAKDAISRRNDDVAGITGREFRRLIYGLNSPLSRLTEYETLDNIGREDLVRWHKSYYHPNNIFLGVSGDFDSARMKAKIEAAFKDWKRGPAFVTPDVPYEKKLKPGVYYIEKADVTQANVRMGHLGIRLQNPDYFAVQVMNEVLGGGFAGRLFSNVRSKKGLAYSVFGGVGSSLSREGIFQVGLSTKSSTMAEAVEALKEEARNIISNPATDEEMARAKESILNSFVFNYDSKRKILGQQMTYAYYGLPANFLETYRNNIEKVTAADVARVARDYVNPDKTILLVVGNAADFDQPVETFGDVAVVDISIPRPGDKRPEVVRTAATLQRGAELVKRVSEKMANGVSERVETAKASYTLALQMGHQAMTIGQEVSYILPDRVRQTVQTPMGEQVVVFNGNSGFMSGGGQTQPMPAEAVTEGLKSLGRDLLVLASNADNPKLEAVSAGIESVGGEKCDVIAVSFMGSESRLFVGPDGRVLKQSWQGKHPFQGTPGLLEILYSNYAPVSGRLYPHMQRMSFEGQEIASITLDSLQVNPPLDAASFEMPTN